MKFNNIVQSEAELRELMGGPVAPPVVEKTLSSLDQHCVAFIGRAPFVLIASSDNKGRMDISPKGDAPGFVRVLDKATLAIPDRPGNQRFDTFRNLFESPRVGLIFLVRASARHCALAARRSLYGMPTCSETWPRMARLPPSRSPCM